MSAGIIPYRITGDGTVRVFIAHQGGPFWEHRDEGAWSIAKGQFDPDEETSWDAAMREFAEEIGMACPDGEVVALEHLRQRRGKTIVAFAVRLDDEASLRFVGSNLFEMEWPPRSGRTEWFVEMDRAEWMDVSVARRKLLSGQLPLMDLLEALAGG